MAIILNFFFLVETVNDTQRDRVLKNKFKLYRITLYKNVYIDPDRSQTGRKSLTHRLSYTEPRIQKRTCCSKIQLTCVRVKYET